MTATAPEIRMSAHEARRAAATEQKPQRVRGIVLASPPHNGTMTGGPEPRSYLVIEGVLSDEHRVHWGRDLWSMP